MHALPYLTSRVEVLSMNQKTGKTTPSQSGHHDTTTNAHTSHAPSLSSTGHALPDHHAPLGVGWGREHRARWPQTMPMGLAAVPDPELHKRNQPHLGNGRPAPADQGCTSSIYDDTMP